MTGILYGVGLGPGDAGLMTRKAAKLIETAKVIAYPTLAGGDSFARSIAADLIGEDVREIVIDCSISSILCSSCDSITTIGVRERNTSSRS